MSAPTATPPAATERTAALISLSLTAVIWGMTPVAIRFLVKDLAAADVLVLRFAICAVVFATLLTVIRGWHVATADWPRFIFSALMGVTGYNLAVNFGYQTTPAGLGSLILGTEPVMIALLAAAVLHEKLSRNVLIGMAISLTGLVILMLMPLLSGASASGASGPLLVWLAAFMWSLQVVIMKPLLLRYGTLRTSALVQLMGTPPILAFASSHTLEVARAMTPMQWTALLLLALLATLLSSFTWNYGVKHVTAASAGAFIYCVPLIAVFAGIFFLGEHLTIPIVLGGLLILAGVAMAQFVKG